MTESLNRPIIKTEIESKKSTESDGFNTEFYRSFQELIPMLSKLFKTMVREGILPIFIYKARLTLMSKPETAKKDNYRSISLMNTHTKCFKEILAN